MAVAVKIRLASERIKNPNILVTDRLYDVCPIVAMVPAIRTNADSE